MKKFSLLISGSVSVSIRLFFLTLSLSLTLLTACQGNDVKETLGMKIDAPDEFAVERKPRLEIPPSFQLRPPAPGEAPVNVADTRDLAKEQVTGVKQTISADSAGEKAILNKFGATNANANIRSVLTEEYPKDSELSTLQKIRSVSDKNINRTLVDQEKEKARIEANLKAQKPVTEGETPTKSTQDGKSIIDKIFD